LDDILEGKLLRLRAWMCHAILVILLYSINNPKLHERINPLKHSGYSVYHQN
jgi:hypothetical protein